MAEADARRKHLAEDLSPYTCPFSDCQEASVLYVTRDAWKGHINRRHGASQYWECLPCTRAEKLEAFSSVDEFTAHTRTHHQGNIAEAQIPALQELCCKTVPPSIPSCPFCSSAQQGPDPVDPASLLEHIGDCIHDFSLKALPWAEAMDREEEFMRTPLLDEKVSRWLDDIDWEDEEEQGKALEFLCATDWSNAEQKNLALKFLSFATQVAVSDQLFVVGEYFAESSESSSLVEREPPPSDPDLPSPNFSSIPSSSEGGAEEGIKSIQSYFTTELLPICEQFAANPPADPKERTEEHHRLSETLLLQALLADAVKIDGDKEAQARRKMLVRQIYEVLKWLDDKMITRTTTISERPNEKTAAEERAARRARRERRAESGENGLGRDIFFQ